MDRLGESRLLEYISLLDRQLSEQTQANDLLANRIMQLEERLANCSSSGGDSTRPDWQERYRRLIETMERSEREHCRAIELQAAAFHKKLSLLEKKGSDLEIQNGHLQRELDDFRAQVSSLQTAHSKDSIDKAYVLNSLNIILDPAKKEFHQEALLMLARAVGGLDEAKKSPRMWEQGNLSELWATYLTERSSSE